MALVEVNWTPSTRDLRQFSVIWLPAFCVLVSAAVLYRTGSLQAALAILCAAAAVGLAGYLVPAVVRTIHTVCLCAAYPIGWLVSHLVLLLVFACVITPAALLMRLVGRDALKREFDRSAKTYWCPRREETDDTRYLRQF